MKKLIVTCIVALLAALSCPRASATTFTLDQVTDVVTPSTRAGANTTYFGWDVLETAGAIDDNTPDLGAATSAKLKTTNGEIHRSDGGNLEVTEANNTLYEQVIVQTNGTIGTAGLTTIVAQILSTTGDFPSGRINLSTINGVLPTVVRGINAAGKGQIWAKWAVSGNALNYSFTITGPASGVGYKIDKIIVDTQWVNATGIATGANLPDEMRLTQPLGLYTGLLTPTGRGNANTTYFGWDTFCEVGATDVPIDDTTPDMGTAYPGARFRTTNGQVHLSSTRNVYVGTEGDTLAEEVTVVTDGVVDAGFTTIIAQAVTAFGEFPATISFGSINGVAPTVVQTTNAIGSGQVWAKWKVPGNAATYNFTVTGPPGVTAISMTKFTVDTFWSSTGYQADSVIDQTPAKSFVLDQLSDVVAPSTRGTANSTWFGWETVHEQGTSAVINDSTPDIGTTTTGVNFKTTNSEDHVSSSGNFFLSTGSVAEEITVATSGSQDASGTTTIIAQIVSQVGFFPGTITLGNINGVAPTVLNGVNGAGRAQLWAKWVVPGNQASYTFTINAPFVDNPSTPYSFERLVVDTIWQESGSQPDSITEFTPAKVFAMRTSPDVVVPSTRGNPKTTWFGWEALNDLSGRANPATINDSTPDIGYTTTGANFQTTNAEDHLLDSGNLYFPEGTLSEQITVPTAGTVGSTGFTTIILQLASAPGFGSFADTIGLSSINGVAPVIVQALNSIGANGTGQLWATWKLPGNQASYTINITGPANQPHFSFDRIVVDTLYSPSRYQSDIMVPTPPSITNASPLTVGIVGLSYSVQLNGTGGGGPYTYAKTLGDLPAGLTLTEAGLLSGTPTTAAVSNFTVQITDDNGLTATKAFALTVAVAPSIITTSLPDGQVGTAYPFTFAASGGTSPYTWEVSDGNLPDGLTLSTAGVTTGTPTEQGTTTFTVKVTDNLGYSAEKEFTVTFISLVVTTASPLPLGVKGVAYSYTFTGTGGDNDYTWTIEPDSGNPPPPLVLSPEGVLSGTPNSAGTATFTVRMTDGNSFSITKEFSLTINANYIKPVVNPLNFGATTIGMEYNYQVSAANYPKTFSITGLPKGLTYVAATGVIKGRPSVSGLFNIQVKATNTAGASVVVTAPLVVKALAKNFVGVFNGTLTRNAVNNNLGSKLVLTTTTIGSYSAKITSGATTTTLKGFLSATAPHIDNTTAGKTLRLTFDGAGLVSGTYSGSVVTGAGSSSATVSGWRQAWDKLNNPASGRAGYYSIGIGLANPDVDDASTIPQGSGYATVTVAEAGTVTIAGKSADGQALTNSTALGPNGEIGVYALAYANKGTLVGKLTLTEDDEFAGNTASGLLSWSKPLTTGKVYADPFGPVDVNAYGRYLAPAAKGNVVLGLPETGAATLVFSDGGIEESVTVPTLEFNYTDENKVAPTNSAVTSLTINAATGAVSGKFTLTETSPALVRKNIAFQGLIVRLANGTTKAVGYFLLPQKPANSTSLSLSGGIAIEQEVAD